MGQRINQQDKAHHQMMLLSRTGSDSVLKNRQEILVELTPRNFFQSGIGQPSSSNVSQELQLLLGYLTDTIESYLLNLLNETDVPALLVNVQLNHQMF
jgi:hypothetical protein